MTLSNIFGSVLGPSSSPGSSHPQKFLSERNSAYYHLTGSATHRKGHSKSDKKHAVLSALTLLAFLFFLNILQNCIREQNANRGTVMMFAPTAGSAPTGHQAKQPSEDAHGGENPPRKKRHAEWPPKNQTGRGRKSRSLLGLEDPTADLPGGREVKFIRNFAGINNNWTRELSPMSDRDLQDQKLKTMNFPLYWKNSRLRATLPRVRESPRRNETVSQPLRKFKKRERTSSTEPTHTDSEPSARDYARPDRFQPSPRIPPHHDRRQSTPPAQSTLNTPATNHPSTTPRNRRSDYSTPRHPPSPADYDHYDHYDRYSDPTPDDSHLAPTSAVGLDLNTFQTFPVHNYYNHRPAPPTPTENHTDLRAPDPTPPQIDRIHSDLLGITTQQPLFHPTRTSPPFAKPAPSHHRLNHGNRLPPHHPHYHLDDHHLSDRYRYSPYRKTAAYDAPHFHDRYYPPVVLAKYEVQHDEPGFDLVKFLWAMVTSFAKPLTKMVPSFAKDSHEDGQCYDLLVCEAQRASRFMGPTAEALATTVGTLLTWAATEETRQVVLDAINSGRENTCQQQIKDCEERSGGKSAMTMIAQVMEMKLR